jgi:polyhydroxyalkanoate synthesis regulator phasin
MINVEGKGKTFSFYEGDFKTTVEQVKNSMIKAKNEFNKIGMDEEAKFKLSKLMETDYLRQLFKELVQSGKISEDEFWNTMTDIKQFSRKDKESKMEGGISNKRFVVSINHILDKDSAEINFEKTDAVRLLKEYPKLKRIYEMTVTEDPATEKQFWEYYLKKNYEYKTEIFGGENPIYTGREERDEKAYEARIR